MPNRSVIDRLRASGGPGLRLLELLNEHRALRTSQLVRLSGAPERTTTYRLTQLLSAGLVAVDRPGAERGSAQRYWWLTPAGAREVTGIAPAEGSPSAMFAPHATTIAELWLAVREHGPATGIHPSGWQVDRAGWEKWRAGPRGAGKDYILTPDAGLRADVPAGETCAFVEVDLDTMTQRRLTKKLDLYLAYAEDRVWAGVWPHCPPLLLLTTTTARTRNWLERAQHTVDRRRRRQGYDARFGAGRRAAREAIGAAERLVIAGCASVHDPAAAVRERVWARAEDPDTLLTLTELLDERVQAQAVAADWYARIATETAEAARLTALHAIGRLDELAELLGDPAAAAALQVLILDENDGPAGFVAAHPALAEQTLTWWANHRQAGDTSERDALAAALRAEHDRLMAEQIRIVLAETDRIAADDLRLLTSVLQLQQGRLLRSYELPGDPRKVPIRPRAETQAELLAAYVTERAAAVDEQIRTAGWLARRRTDARQLAAGYDDTRLLVCDTCGIVVAHPPRPVPDEVSYEPADPGPCLYCTGTGTYLPYAARDQVPTLTDRLADLRTRLTT